MTRTMVSKYKTVLKNMRVKNTIFLMAAALLFYCASGVTLAADADFVRDDEYYKQWGLEMINAAAAYTYESGFTGKGILVGVIDTGINSNHNEFKYHLYIDRVTDENGHGSHVSGIIAAARDEEGMHGVAHDCQLIVYKIADATNTASFINALEYMTDPAKCAGGEIPLVINNSWGFDDDIGPGLTGDVINTNRENILASPVASEILNLIAKAVNQGQLLVFAAGNSWCDNVEVSAGLPYLFPELNLTRGYMAVAAVDSSGEIAWYSTRAGVGKYWTIAAPGGGYDEFDDGIYSVDNKTDEGYVLKNGTSMAAPHVSGAAALVWEAFPYFTNAQVAQMLFLTADNSGDYSDMDTYGWGLLNVGNAVQGKITRDTLNFDKYAGKFILVVPIKRKDLDITVQKSSLILEENYTFSGIDVSDGGILTVNQNLADTDITIDVDSFLKGSGNIANSTVDIDGGTLAPGNSPSVLTLQGSTVNLDNGTFQPFLSDYGYSQLLLMDDSELNLYGDINIDPEFPEGYHAKIGGKYNVLKVQDTSTVNYDNGSFSITQLTEPGIQYNAINSESEFNLYITPRNYTDTAAIGISFDENQAQIATIWENNRPQADIVDLSSLTKEQQDIYPLIYQLDASSLRQSASQMSGQLIADTRAGTFNQLRSLNESLHEMNGNNETIKIFGQKLRIEGGQFPGGNLTSTGIIINHQLGSDEKSNYGVGLSVVSGKQRSNYDLGQGTLDSYSLHLYKNTYQPNGKYWFALLGLGQTRQEIDRKISGAGNLNSTGTGSHFFAGLGTGKARDIGAGSFKLETALFWENAKSPAISETGNQTFTLKSESSRDDRLAAQILLKRKHILNAGTGLTTALETNLGVSHDFSDLQNQSSMELLGTRMNIRSEKLGATAFKYGLGFSWNWNKKHELKLMASGEKRSNANQGAIEVLYKMKY